jgi:Family of unknown function (DUF5763)
MSQSIQSVLEQIQLVLSCEISDIQKLKIEKILTDFSKVAKKREPKDVSSFIEQNIRGCKNTLKLKKKNKIELTDLEEEIFKIKIKDVKTITEGNIFDFFNQEFEKLPDAKDTEKPKKEPNAFIKFKNEGHTTEEWQKLSETEKQALGKKSKTVKVSTRECLAIKKDGSKCTLKHSNENDYCSTHANYTGIPKIKVCSETCKATTKKGNTCSKHSIKNGFCALHQNVSDEKVEIDEIDEIEKSNEKSIEEKKIAQICSGMTKKGEQCNKKTTCSSGKCKTHNK